jgi:hypothetical protein
LRKMKIKVKLVDNSFFLEGRREVVLLLPGKMSFLPIFF